MIIKTDQDAIQSYLEDSSNVEGGRTEKVVFPETIDELSAVLKEAAAARVPVTISGGGTGTAGGRIPFGGITVSMERLNRILAITADSRGGGSATVQAGTLVEDLKNEAEKKGLFYTCHPTEKTAFLGGTVATNASGARSFKYGATRKFVKRLIAVLADGTVMPVVRGERFITKKDPSVMISGKKIVIPLPTYRMPAVKNSAGYFIQEGTDLIDLFIGQEGTLAAIAEIEIDIVAKPEDIFSCFAFFENEQDAWSFSLEARGKARRGGTVGTSIDPLSLEYMDKNSLSLLRGAYPRIPKNARASVYFEQEITSTQEDRVLKAWQGLLEKYNVSIDDTWVAMTEKEQNDFLTFRHAVPHTINELVRKNGFKKMSTDISVPDGSLIEMMRFYKETLSGFSVPSLVFGHIGESHLHMNLLPRSEDEFRKAKELCLACVRKGVALGGSVSAEHGIGKTRHLYLDEMYGREGVLEMARIKKAFDPECILGLDNIFPRTLLSEA